MFWRVLSHQYLKWHQVLAAPFLLGGFYGAEASREVGDVGDFLASSGNFGVIGGTCCSLPNGELLFYSVDARSGSVSA